MNQPDNNSPRFCRAKALLIAGFALALAESAAAAEGESLPSHARTSSWAKPQNPHQPEAFWGAHQGGITTPPQHHTYFAAFDLITTNRQHLILLLQAWTAAAARMAQGDTGQPLNCGFKPAVPPNPRLNPNEDDSSDATDPSTRVADSGETVGMSPGRLTVTLGFGAGIFTKDGNDRYGLASRRPAALVDMPRFPGDQILPIAPMAICPCRPARKIRK